MSSDSFFCATGKREAVSGGSAPKRRPTHLVHGATGGKAAHDDVALGHANEGLELVARVGG